MITDPIADFITRIENASKAGKYVVSMPFSHVKLAIAEALKREGYLSTVEQEGKKVKKELTVTLATGEDGVPTLRGTKRISKPSRRVYVGARDIRPVKQNHGQVIISTPEGIMTGVAARAAGIGGEMLFEIW